MGSTITVHCPGQASRKQKSKNNETNQNIIFAENQSSRHVHTCINANSYTHTPIHIFRTWYTLPSSAAPQHLARQAIISREPSSIACVITRPSRFLGRHRAQQKYVTPLYSVRGQRLIYDRSLPQESSPAATGCHGASWFPGERASQAGHYSYT